MGSLRSLQGKKSPHRRFFGGLSAKRNKLLAYRLEEPRIRKVIETIMAGGSDPSLADSEGFRLCEDLGLVSRERGTPVVANPIYREALARQMTCGTQAAVPEPEWRWEKLDGSLDMERLMKEFQQFWHENSEVWERKSNYTEAFPHLFESLV
jgi:hypothetical protein